MKLVRYCSWYPSEARGLCSNYRSRSTPGMDGEVRGGDTWVHRHVPKLIVGVISGALTLFFALVGAFTGVVTGALAGRASDIGVLRGAGLGAIAGAVLSVEVLDASRAYCYSEISGSRNSTSLAEFMEQFLRGRFVEEQFTPAMLTAYRWQAQFMEQLLRGRFVEEQFTPAMLTAYRWQVRVASIRYDEVYDVSNRAASKGLSGDSLKKLPQHEISADMKTAPTICCTICLQDIEVGETARSLPRCLHTFHLTCVDKWLVRHGSCPVCRQDV